MLDRTFDDAYVSRVIYMTARCVGVVEPGDRPTDITRRSATSRGRKSVIHRETNHEARWRAAPSIFIFVLALTLAACGGDGASEDTGSGGQETTKESTQESTQTASDARRYALPGDEVYPEGVAYRSETGEFFVGSTTDGTVFRGNVGEPGAEAEVFLIPGEDGRTATTGMKVDPEGRLFIAGGDTGQLFIYDTSTGEALASFRIQPEDETTFVNDVALGPDGSAYFTDSMNPQLYRLFPYGEGGYGFEPFLDLEGTPIEYGEGFNLNGIAATEDGRYLITAQSNTGNLYRIDTGSKEVTRVDLGGETLENGDGILLDGRTLYVVRNRQGLIVPVDLSEDFASGEVGEGFTDPSLAYPTTIAAYDGRLLVVNSQFDRRQSGEEPELPFTVSSIEVP
jgi:sugar lactone lactonase YvrE